MMTRARTVLGELKSSSKRSEKASMASAELARAPTSNIAAPTANALLE